MSYTDLRDFETEYTLRVDGTGVVIDVEKLGGGTVGRSYEGQWRYVVTDLNGVEISYGQDLYTGTPKTHAQAARLVLEFLDGDDH